MASEKRKPEKRRDTPRGRKKTNLAMMAERRSDAWKMRVKRKTYEQIGQALGVSTQTAYEYCQYHYNTVEIGTAETVREAKTRDLETVEQLLDVWVPRALGSEDKAPTEGAVAAVNRLLQHRAKLLGLEAPTQAEVSGPEGGPIPVAVASIVLRLDGEERSFEDWLSARHGADVPGRGSNGHSAD